MPLVVMKPCSNESMLQEMGGRFLQSLPSVVIGKRRTQGFVPLQLSQGRLQLLDQYSLFEPAGKKQTSSQGGRNQRGSVKSLKSGSKTSKTLNHGGWRITFPSSYSCKFSAVCYKQFLDVDFSACSCLMENTNL